MREDSAADRPRMHGCGCATMPEDMKRSDDIDGSIIIASVIRMLYFRIIMLHGIMSILYTGGHLPVTSAGLRSSGASS